MTELEQILIGASAAAPPDAILQGVEAVLAHRRIDGAPHTVYEELWHVVLWQEMTLDWVQGIETAFPVHASAGFPSEGDAGREDWDHLCRRFFEGARQAAAIAGRESGLDRPVRCPSRPGSPVRTMTVREQLESLGAHNAYHFGRIVLMRQILGSWPPPSGGYSW